MLNFLLKLENSINSQKSIRKFNLKLENVRLILKNHEDFIRNS